MAPVKVKVTVRIAPELAASFQKAANKRSLNQTRAVEEAIRQWLKWLAIHGD